MKMKPIENMFFKWRVNDRVCGEVADDSKIFKRAKPQRRRSVVYVK